jgi:hypothetical protein
VEATPDPALYQRIMRLIFGAILSKSVYAAAKLGIADELANSALPVEELARRTETDPDALYRLLRALAGEGLFDEVEPRIFSLTDLGRLISEDAPASRRYLSLMFAEQTDPVFEHILDSIRTGAPATTALGKPYWDWLADNPDASEIFNKAMSSGATMRLPTLLPLPLWDGATRVVDVGGGNGTALVALLTKHPHLQGIVYDLPHIRDDVGRSSRASGRVSSTIRVTAVRSREPKSRPDRPLRSLGGKAGKRQQDQGQHEQREVETPLHLPGRHSSDRDRRFRDVRRAVPEASSKRSAERETGFLQPRRRVRQPHRLEVRLRDHGEPEQVRHALPIRLAVCGQREHRLQQRLELERRPHFADEAHLAVARVPEAMRSSGLDDEHLVALERQLVSADLEPQRPVDHGEALGLRRMDVGGRDEAPGLDDDLDHDRLAVRVGGGGEKRDALARDGVVDAVACADHLCLLRVFR